MAKERAQKGQLYVSQLNSHWITSTYHAYLGWVVKYLLTVIDPYQGYYLDEWLVYALGQVKFNSYAYVSNTYSFAYLIFLKHLKWVKTYKFLILRNATSMSTTNLHSSNWVPRLLMEPEFENSVKMVPLWFITLNMLNKPIS